MSGQHGRGLALVISIIGGVFWLAACAGSGPSSSIAPPPTVEGGPAVEIPPNATIVELAIAAEGRGHAPFQQNGEPVHRIEVKAGQPYVFRVTNPGSFDHNFWIGGAKDLASREYDRLQGVDLWSNGVREIVYTFEPGGPALQFACTLAGHYGVMHADIAVVP